jgi:hypothetical protein
MSDPIVPTADQGNPPADNTVSPPASNANPTPPASGDPAPPSDGATTLTLSQAAFNERLERAQKSAQKALLEDLGVKDPEELKAAFDAAKAAQAAAEEAKRKEMSEIERLQADLAALKEANASEAQARATAEKQAEALRVQNHLQQLFAERGIKNTKYAMFLVEQEKSKLEGDNTLDEAKFLDDLAEDPSEAAALGLKAASDAPTEPRDANTTNPRTGPDPAPDDGDGSFDAMSADPEALKKRLAQLGFHG